MITRERLSMWVIQVSLGLGGGLLAALFASEAYLHGGFAISYAVGVFVMVGMSAKFFGGVKVWVYCLTTLVITVLLLALGIPR